MRLLSIADAPTDDDGSRLRKRVGVAARIATVIAPLALPLQAPGQPLAIVFGLGLSLYSVTTSRSSHVPPTFGSAGIWEAEPEGAAP